MKSYGKDDFYIKPFYFETFIDTEVSRRFYQKYWHYSIYISFIYLIVIYFLREYMKYRPAFDLRRASIIWNGILAIYSITMTLRGFRGMILTFKTFPFYNIICDSSLLERNPQLIFWNIVFSFSKVWELGDTILIILRKRNLIFLHWYHHTATLILAWFSAYKEISYGYLIIYINVFVHSFMYSYFTLKCMNIKIPIKVAMFITAIQILQMILAIFITFSVYLVLIDGYECDTPRNVLESAFGLYFSYLILFCYLFYNSYIKPILKRKID